MKSQTYMNRALQSRDPRFARILGRLGYGDAPDQPAAPAATSPEAERAALREAYKAATGKKPFGGWDAETLREKIAAAAKA